MLRYVVELLASRAGKFNRQNLGALEYDPLLSYVGYLEGKEWAYLSRKWKIDSWVEAFQTLFEWANALGVLMFNSLPDLLDFAIFIVI